MSSLKLNSTDPAHELGAVLQRKAESGVEIKILIWHNWIANTFSTSAGKSSLHNPAFRLRTAWNQREAAFELALHYDVDEDFGKTYQNSTARGQSRAANPALMR